MSSNVSTLGASPDATYGHGSQASPQDLGKTPPVAAENPVSVEDFGLVIEEDAAVGAPIYKMVDRKTGKVVHQYKRDALLRMREADRYAAGDVIKTIA